MKTNIYIEINTKEQLPENGGYYSIITTDIIPHVHWSVEEQIWTTQNGEKLEATYPNCWLVKSDIDSVISEAIASHEAWKTFENDHKQQACYWLLKRLGL